jgi:hypothetical protein
MRAPGLDVLLGVEGAGAGGYFKHFSRMLRSSDGPDMGFDFNTRNRRPPRDPVNAMLSFAYAMLTREWTVTLAAVGLDPYRGFYHQPRFGRPALALDMMEPFRPLVADSIQPPFTQEAMLGYREANGSSSGLELLTESWSVLMVNQSSELAPPFARAKQISYAAVAESMLLRPPETDQQERRQVMKLDQAVVVYRE